jgi:voltage-gated potassium channel
MTRYEKIKRETYEIIETGKETGQFHHYFDDYFIMGLIVLNVVAIILESYSDLHAHYRIYFHYFDLFSVVVFTLEYSLRFWTADYKYPSHSRLSSKIKYMKSPFGIIDLLAILPFYLPMIITFDLRFIRILRVFRLLRIFKFGRYSKSLKIIGDVLKAKKAELGVTLFVTSILLLLTSTMMFYIEHDAQPDKFPNILESFWWAIVTLTTIGYGDVFPITGWGQLLAGITAVLGIGLVAIPTGIVSSGFMSELSKNETPEVKEEICYCPYCGKKIKT